MENTTNLITMDTGTSTGTALFTSDLPSTTVAPFVIHYWERVIVALMYLLIFLVGIIGNSMVIVAVILSRKLRSPTNCLITNLATSDLLTCLMLIWNVVALLSRSGWPVGDKICTVAGTLIYTSSGTSLYSLAAIAVNRLIRITRPSKFFDRVYTYRNVATMIAFTWIIPLPLIIIPPLFDVGEIGYDSKDYTCSDLELHPESKIFNYYQSAVVPIPLITIVVCYGLILKHIRRHFMIQKLRKTLPSSLNRKPSSFKCSETDDNTSSTPTKTIIPPAVASLKFKTPPFSPQNKIDTQQLAVTMNLFYVVLAFMVCSLPYFFALLFAAIVNTDHFMFYAGAILLASSAINPAIYAWKHPHFKLVLKAMLCCQYREIPQPSVAAKRVIKMNAIELPSSSLPSRSNSKSFPSRSNSKSLPSRPSFKNSKRESREGAT